MYQYFSKNEECFGNPSLESELLPDALDILLVDRSPSMINPGGGGVLGSIKGMIIPGVDPSMVSLVLNSGTVSKSESGEREEQDGARGDTIGE
mmetsp:Transcript_34735/g.50995  ORF Transcript_34735/g.50995 Transcript_34735/m.50995 type:complete len:93 (-) Transcript_34735:188-466(-)